jgi:hypothetical protein
LAACADTARRKNDASVMVLMETIVARFGLAYLATAR